MPDPEMTEAEKRKTCPSLRRGLDQIHLALVFFTRLPLPPLRTPVPGIGQALWAVPLVGLLVGAGMATVWAGAMALGTSAGVAAVLVVGSGLLLTGALHEDGLADVADGFWGGHDRQRRLEILRDSRLGTYGAVALILVLALRIMALTGAGSTSAGTIALLVAPMLGRTSLPVTLTLLPPARTDGLGAGAGRVPGLSLMLALALGLGGAAALGGWVALQAATVAGGLLLGLCWLAWRKVGGQTGDVLGAGAAICETVCLIWIVEGL